MNAPIDLDRRQLDRRQVLAGGGALIVSFSLTNAFAEDQAAPPATAPAPPPPGSLKASPYLDSWLRIDADGSITVFTGKAELGQGFKTAFQQIAAEELDVPFASLKVVTADTKLTANEGYTSGSHSMQDSGTAIQNAAAQARALLVNEAAKRLDLPLRRLKTENGAVIGSNGRRLSYGELVAGDMLHVQATPTSKLKDPATFKVMGKSVPRVDIPAKVTGGAAYVQDMRPAGMVHARVVRPPSYGAELTGCDTAAVGKMPGVVKVVRDGNFLAVVGNGEFQTVKAMKALAAAAQWKETAKLPKQDDLASVLTSLPAQTSTIYERNDPTVFSQKTIEATYTRPYQAHGSIGPSCAVAEFTDGKMTVWTHTQGVYPDRQGIAEMLHMPPDDVRCIHVEGSGCYGHNGADDAAADAALIARAMPDTPVRVQWMREQEHGWEPFGPAMMTRLKASLDGDGKIADWNFEVWSNTHSMRPGGAGLHAGGPAYGAAFRGAGAKALAAPRRRRRPQRDPDLHLPERACRTSLSSRHAAADLGDAFARRVSQRVFDRELHGRARRRRGRRSRRVPAEASRRSARAAKSSRRRRRSSAGARTRSRRGIAATASPSRATRTSRPIARLRCEIEVNRETGRARLGARRGGGRQRAGGQPGRV